MAERQTTRHMSSYQDVLDLDTHEVPAVIREESPGKFTDADLPIGVYLSREQHDRERERLWTRVWQFVCREEHLPDVGDHVVYDIAGMSYVVIRSAEDQIKAFPNACLHRGRQLKQFDGWCSEIRCPFHGFAWELDGRLKHIPAADEFPHVDPDEFQLPEARVDTWAGFVFINPDPDAEPLTTFLGEIVEHFDRWGFEDRYTRAHVSKLLRCNWKVAQEAFMECWHVQSTHPQTLPYAGVPLCRVDVYDNFARFITPSEVSSPLLSWTPDAEDMLRATLDIRVDEELPLRPRDGETARDLVVRLSRAKWRELIGDRVETWSDAELVDNFTYTVFPNMLPWGGVHTIVYRFRPNGDDHRTCIMDVFLVAPFTGDRPPPATEQRLGFDDPWTSVPELGILAKIFEQDTYNMERVQTGLETTVKPGVTLAAYQEDNIKWFHQRLAQWMASEE